MRQVPDRSNHLPEDDLPSWVLYTEDCPDCSGTIDEGHNYSEYDMEVCSCGKTWTIDVYTMWPMLDRDEWLADRVADTIQDIDEVLTARQLIDMLFERNTKLAEMTLDYLSNLHDGASGYWEDDGENMILLSWDAYYSNSKSLFSEEQVIE